MPTTKYGLGWSLSSSIPFKVKLLANFACSEAVVPLKFGDKEPQNWPGSRENLVVLDDGYNRYKWYSDAFQERCEGKRGCKS